MDIIINGYILKSLPKQLGMVEKVEKFTVGKIKFLPKRMEKVEKVEKFTTGKIEFLPKRLGKVERGRGIHSR